MQIFIALILVMFLGLFVLMALANNMDDVLPADHEGAQTANTDSHRLA